MGSSPSKEPESTTYTYRRRTNRSLESDPDIQGCIICNNIFSGSFMPRHNTCKANYHVTCWRVRVNMDQSLKCDLCSFYIGNPELSSTNTQRETQNTDESVSESLRNITLTPASVSTNTARPVPHKIDQPTSSNTSPSPDSSKTNTNSTKPVPNDTDRSSSKTSPSPHQTNRPAHQSAPNGQRCPKYNPQRPQMPLFNPPQIRNPPPQNAAYPPPYQNPPQQFMNQQFHQSLPQYGPRMMYNPPFQPNHPPNRSAPPPYAPNNFNNPPNFQQPGPPPPPMNGYPQNTGQCFQYNSRSESHGHPNGPNRPSEQPSKRESSDRGRGSFPPRGRGRGNFSQRGRCNGAPTGNNDGASKESSRGGFNTERGQSKKSYQNRGRGGHRGRFKPPKGRGAHSQNQRKAKENDGDDDSDDNDSDTESPYDAFPEEFGFLIKMYSPDFQTALNNIPNETLNMQVFGFVLVDPPHPPFRPNTLRDVFKFLIDFPTGKPFKIGPE